MQGRLALHPVLEPVRDRPRRTMGPRPLPWLLVVAGAFTAVQLILVVPGSGLGWDETVYVSQVGGNAPAAYFSAPRARGISYLVAPVATLTASTTAIRVHLALLSGGALFTCLWIWRSLLPVRVLACAGAFFAGLWITLFYGPRAMPNLWCAFGALAAVGWFLRALRRPAELRAFAGLAAAVALVALMRPGDGLWLALPLAAAALLVPGWRRPAVVAAIGAGFLLGALPWVIEAYAHYGGLSARLHRASEIQGGLGWHLAVDDQVRALDGRALCRPCTVEWRHPVAALWWFALPVLAVGGVAAAFRAQESGYGTGAGYGRGARYGRGAGPSYTSAADAGYLRAAVGSYRRVSGAAYVRPRSAGSPYLPAYPHGVNDVRRGPAALLATATAASLAFPYLFLIDYAAPRFLLPAYALLAIPVAECLVFLAGFLTTAVRPSLQPYGAAALALVLTGHLAVQYGVLTHMLGSNRSLRAHYTAIAAEMRRLGVRPPCLLTGRNAVPIAYYAGCASRQSGGHDASITPDGIEAAARRMPVAVIVAYGGAPPAYARTWRATDMPDVRGLGAYRVYLPPSPVGAPTMEAHR